MFKISTRILNFVFFICALQILNLSVDIDHATRNGNGIVDYDDVDSIAEYVVELCVGNTNFTSEHDNDAGKTPLKNGVQLHSYSVQLLNEIFYRNLLTIPVSDCLVAKRAVTPIHLTQAGYLTIITPPPDLA